MEKLIPGKKTVGFFEVSLLPCLSIPFDHCEKGKGSLRDCLRLKRQGSDCCLNKFIIRNEAFQTTF